GGNFMKIDMQHMAAERVMLHFLHEREALRVGIIFDRQIHEHIFGDGMEDQIADFAGVDLNALRFGFAAVNDGGNTPFRAKFLCPSPASERTGKRVQWYRFHFLKLFRLRSSQLVRPPLNSNSEFTDELLWIRLIASPKSPATD